ncbi:MAG: TetR/AcrR family transcriptional regulator [Microcoleaceae cyanobacterium]
MDRSTVIPYLLEVFRKYGYEGATLSRISEVTGLGRASLYHHFPGGKQEMGKAVLEHVSQLRDQIILKPLRESGDPVERLKNMMSSLNMFYNNGSEACLIAIFSLGEPSTLFGDDVKQSLTILITEIAQVLIEAGLSPELARHRAEEAIMHIQGALIVSRGLQSLEPFERVMSELPERLTNR